MDLDLFRLISYSTSHLFLIGFVLVFITWRFSAARTFAFAGLSAAAMWLLEGFRYSQSADVSVQAWTLFAQAAVYLWTAIYLSRYRDPRSLFTGFAANNYVMIGTLVSRTIFDYGGGAIIAIAAGTAIHALVLILLAVYLRPAYLKLQLVRRDREWLALSAVPLSLYLAMLYLRKTLNGPDLGEHLAMLFLLVTVLVTYVLVFGTTRTINQRDEADRRVELLQANIKAQKRAVEEIRIAERETAVQNHDRRQLIRTMQALMAKHDYDAVNEILSRHARAAADFDGGGHYCDNVPVNGVVVYYVSAARGKGIRILTTLDIPEELPVDEWELSVVIGNLLENAVQAAGEVKDPSRREVWMTARQMRGQMLIEIRNTYEGALHFDRRTGFPLSQKGEGHGLGLQSVAYFAECSSGTFDCGISDGRFFARLLL